MSGIYAKKNSVLTQLSSSGSTKPAASNWLFSSVTVAPILPGIRKAGAHSSAYGEPLGTLGAGYLEWGKYGETKALSPWIWCLMFSIYFWKPLEVELLTSFLVFFFIYIVCGHGVWSPRNREWNVWPGTRLQPVQKGTNLKVTRKIWSPMGIIIHS